MTTYNRDPLKRLKSKTFTFTAEHLQQIKEEAKQRNMSCSALVRRALVFYFGEKYLSEREIKALIAEYVDERVETEIARTVESAMIQIHTTRV